MSDTDHRPITDDGGHLPRRCGTRPTPTRRAESSRRRGPRTAATSTRCSRPTGHDALSAIVDAVHAQFPGPALPPHDRRRRAPRPGALRLGARRPGRRGHRRRHRRRRRVAADGRLPLDHRLLRRPPRHLTPSRDHSGERGAPRGALFAASSGMGAECAGCSTSRSAAARSSTAPARRGRRADVGIAGGRVVAIGDVGRATPTTIDADGRVVAPGFVDVHTHFDAQVFWDPLLTPVVAARRHDRARRQLRLHARAARRRDAGRLPGAHAGRRRGHAARRRCRPACRGDWRSTGEYLDRLDGTLAHQRRLLVGPLGAAPRGDGRRRRPSAPADARRARRAWCTLLRAGPRRRRARVLVVVGRGALRRRRRRRCRRVRADLAELLALAAVCGEFEGTSLEFIPAGSTCSAPPSATTLVGHVRARPGGRSTGTSCGSPPTPSTRPRAASTADAPRRASGGGRVVGAQHADPLAGALLVPHRASCSTRCPGWGEVLVAAPRRRAPRPARPRRAGPARRRRGPRTAACARSPSGATASSPRCSSPRSRAVRGPPRRRPRRARRASTPLDALLDVVCADELRPRSPARRRRRAPTTGRPASTLWRDGRRRDRRSDAGAHLDFTAYFDYPVYILEQAVRAPRRALARGGRPPHDRRPGAALRPARPRPPRARRRAPTSWCSTPTPWRRASSTTRFDLPAGAGRLYAEPVGIDARVGQRRGDRRGRLAHRRAPRHAPALRPRHAHAIAGLAWRHPRRGL